MDINLPERFYNILNKDFRKFKSCLLDENYELFNKYDKKELEVLFLYSIVDNPNGMKSVKKKLLKNNINEKEINNLFYTILKFKYKQERGLWSWNEIEEMDIELDSIKETSTKYSFY
jgi:hypothetical protein|tara:strand:- start:156 stop:506 length:351 start_codon:yes stop_codon:yes gene_type:complete